MKYNTKEVHISTIKIGDTVNHNGSIRTVGKNNIKYNYFTGTTLWGNSYRLGLILVKKIII
jgi:hypothetical protein